MEDRKECTRYIETALPQGQGESFYQFPQFETFGKCVGDEVFSKHGSLGKHEVNQSSKQRNGLNHTIRLGIVSPPAGAYP